MDASRLTDLGLLLLRGSVAWVFLYAGYRNVQNADAWKWTVGETAVLLPETLRPRLARVCAIAGMVMMFGGGASVASGFEPRLGALALLVFSALGMRIHAVRRDEAKAAATANASDAMAWSAYSAHTAAGLKNIALIGAALMFLCAGTGACGMQQDFIRHLLVRD